MSQLQVTGEAKIRDIQGPVVANSGVITALDGAASQYVRGDGTLADFPSSSGGGSSVSYYLNSSVSQGTIGGVAYRELSKDPIIGTGTDITISSNGYVANYITDANDPDVVIVPGGNFNCEFYFSVNNNTGNPTTYAELYKYDGSTFTLLGSSVGVPESINQGTTIAPYYFAIPVATATLALTDRLAIRIYVNVNGRTVTLHTENGHLCQVVTTLSKGMVSLNNLTDQSQYLTTGTSGTNFNIVSSGDTHTFNIPSASATNTGKLSNTDWSTFNNKQAALSFTAPLVNTSNTVSIPAASSTVDGYLDNADWTTFNNKQNAITLTTTGTSGAATLVGSTLNIPNYGSALSGYLPLSGGTLTGQLNGTHIVLSGSITSNTLYTTNELYSVAPAGVSSLLTLNVAGALSGTSATFSGNVSAIADSNAVAFIAQARTADDLAQISFKNNANSNTNALISVSKVGTNGGQIQFITKPDGSSLAAALTLASTGAATFSSSVTATQGNFSLGTVGGAIGSVKNLSIANTNGAVGDWAGLNFGYYNSTTNFGYIGTVLTSDAGNSTADLVFGVKSSTSATSVTEYMRIKTGGNVGIGTSSPSASVKLEVYDSSANGDVAMFSTAGTKADIWLKDVNTSAGAVRLRSESNSMIMTAGGSERMRITSGGDVCVGKTDGAFGNIGHALFQNGQVSHVTSSDASLFLNRLGSTGNIAYFYSNSSQVGSISVTGSATAYNTSSDYRLKTDFKDFSGLDLVSNIKTYDYEWKSDKSRSYGVIAHELAEVIPYAVNGEKDGENMQGVDYSKIVPILVKAIQEQQTQIEELKALINK